MYREGLRAPLHRAHRQGKALSRAHALRTRTSAPRARGHYLRQGEAVDELLACRDAVWTEERILRAAQRHDVCPFELALALVDLADVVLMDLNYAFDPFAQVKRLFQHRRDMTLLVDEAHSCGGTGARQPFRRAGQPGTGMPSCGAWQARRAQNAVLLRADGADPAAACAGREGESPFERTLKTLPEGIVQ